MLIVPVIAVATQVGGAPGWAATIFDQPAPRPLAPLNSGLMTTVGGVGAVVDSVLLLRGLFPKIRCEDGTLVMGYPGQPPIKSQFCYDGCDPGLATATSPPQIPRCVTKQASS